MKNKLMTALKAPKAKYEPVKALKVHKPHVKMHKGKKLK